jgi:predicted O-methyltransferase YrrM
MKTICRIILLLLILSGCAGNSGYTQDMNELDKRVRDFLNSHAYSWNDLNVPASDGKLLYDIIIKNNYKKALEIGTSTGHSAIWIAWALSKTGGKLITIEIDERRYKEALINFEKAGLSNYIDARLADAHKLTPALTGTFDFVFSDADKNWYINYFRAIDPKLEAGGCFTSHNVSQTNNRDYYDYVRALPNYETSLDNRGAGVCISYKRSR